MTFISNPTISKYVSKSKCFESSIDIPKCARLKMMFAVTFSISWLFSLVGWACVSLFHSSAGDNALSAKKKA
ncbi:MAG: hypothetical protein WCR19_03005 [Acholeplasmataceae bacterium]